MVDEARRLAAELQRDRREVFGRFMHDHFAYLYTSGEEDIIELLLQQTLVFSSSALHHGDILGRERLADEFGDDLGGGRRVSRRLEDHGVTRCNSANEGFEREEHRVVPRRHNQHHAIRVLLNHRLRREIGEGRAFALGACPAAEVLAHVADLGEGQSHLTHIRLGGRLTQVGT